MLFSEAWGANTLKAGTSQPPLQPLGVPGSATSPPPPGELARVRRGPPSFTHSFHNHYEAPPAHADPSHALGVRHPRGRVQQVNGQFQPRRICALMRGQCFGSRGAPNPAESFPGDMPSRLRKRECMKGQTEGSRKRKTAQAKAQG